MEEVFLLVRMGFALKNRLFLQVDWLQKTVEANLFSFQSPQGELWPRAMANVLINFGACQAQSQQSIDGQLLHNLLHNVSMTWTNTQG